MNKKKVIGLLGITSILGVTIYGKTDTAFAHGYVESPPARGYQGQLDSKSLGWDLSFKLYGNVITNPQSLEGPKGFPTAGPVDGHIASANGGLGQINDFTLDEQTSKRWKKTDVHTGPTTFTWHYTAPHKTSKWHYYMTKNGWNQNAPLSRDELQLIGEVKHDGSSASNNLSHTINIPKDRSGYNIILAVWDVSDTTNAFYNVIDVNVNDSNTSISSPTHLQCKNVGKDYISLSWNSQINASKYNIYRDGIKIQTINSNKYDDKDLSPGTEYSYKIEAVSANGEIFDKSNVIKVRTLYQDSKEKPTTPTNLHPMNITSKSATLIWEPSQHSSGIQMYEIYRNGSLVGNTTEECYTDDGLSSSTNYTYAIKALSNGGGTSELSNNLIITTKSMGTSELNDSWRRDKVYLQGDHVIFKGKEYEAMWWNTNHQPNQSEQYGPWKSLF